MADLKSRQTFSRDKKESLKERKRGRDRRIASWMLFLIVIAVAFVCGFLFRSNTPLMTTLGIPTEASDSQGAITSSKMKSTYDSLSMRISEVEDMLSAHSFDEVHLDIATNSMLADLIGSTEDPYATYYTQERYEAYMLENADRNLGGIGVLFGDYNGRAYAIDVLAGSQAQAAGVTQGDFIVAIDGDSARSWSTTEVIGAISKPDGSNVVITWMHPLSLDATTGEEFTTSLECRQYDVENVTYELQDTVGYIKLRQITANSSALIERAVKELSSQGAASFVLDVTDNPGGYLTQSIDIESLFLQSGVVVGIKTIDGTSLRNASGTTLTSAPLVVMVNSFTSGVAEVLAAALQDNQRATLVGQRTMGKGSVQVTRELSFGGAIRYTAAYYITPNGQNLNNVGVTPSIEVANRQDGDEVEDIQRLVALDTARSMTAG